MKSSFMSRSRTPSACVHIHRDALVVRLIVGALWEVKLDDCFMLSTHHWGIINESSDSCMRQSKFSHQFCHVLGI